jgi:hypothetical protein
MARTHTANWDFNHFPASPAPLNDICPKCGKPCHSVVVVNEKLYFCCNVVKIDIELMKAVKAIRAEWEAQGFLPPYDMADEGFMTLQEIRRDVGV